jgi:hypothetical protein
MHSYSYLNLHNLVAHLQRLAPNPVYLTEPDSGWEAQAFYIRDSSRTYARLAVSCNGAESSHGRVEQIIATFEKNKAARIKPWRTELIIKQGSVKPVVFRRDFAPCLFFGFLRQQPPSDCYPTDVFLRHELAYDDALPE